MMGVSIPVTYLILASPSAMVPGLGLAAVGLALKMVVLQVIGVNILSYLIARTNGWAYDYGYQAVVLVALLILSYLCRGAGEWALGLAGLLGGDQLGLVVLGICSYTAVSLGLLYWSPWLAGLTRDQIQFAISRAARRLRLVAAASR